MLDCGATGIVVPDVNTVADAQKAVATCKFAPVGRRSVGGLYPALDFKTAPLTETLQVLNNATLLVCMIETVEGRARFESHGDLRLAREIDDLLQARAAGSLRDHDALQWIAYAQRLDNRMNTAQQGHRDQAHDHRAAPVPGPSCQPGPGKPPPRGRCARRR